MIPPRRRGSQDTPSEAGPGPAALLAEALRLLDRHGWVCVPWRCDGGRKRPACGRWKHLAGGGAAAPEVAALFDEQPGEVTGLAVILGAASAGLCVADFDDLSAYRAWRADRPELAEALPASRTGRGAHVFFRSAAEVYGQLPAGAGQLLGDRRHVAVLPPSLHPSGGRYHWLATPGDLLPLVDPADAFGFSGRGAAAPKAPAAGNRTCPVSGLAGLIEACIPDRVGVRNHCLWRLAVRLRSMPQTRGASAATLEPILLGWYGLAVESPMRTKELAVSLSDFARQWEAAGRSGGATAPLVRAMGDALARPLPPDPWPDPCEPARLLAALCGQLQRVNGPGRPWPLTRRDAKEVCGYANDRTAGNHLSRMVRLRLLTLAHRGLPGAGGSGFAHCFTLGPLWRGP